MGFSYQREYNEKPEEKLDKLIEESGYKKIKYVTLPHSISASNVIKMRKKNMKRKCKLVDTRKNVKKRMRKNQK